MFPLLPTIAEVQSRFYRGELIPSDLVRQCLTNIAIYEGQIRAWVMVDGANAMILAEDASHRIKAEPSDCCRDSPLLGIPLGVKDIIDVADWATKAGSRLRDQHVAKASAIVVERLRAAGAHFLGKTVTTEFACFDPPVTRNPWHLAHTPGGSSSGSAAAVAAGMCMAALGSQTGGSILRPAAFCGIVGFKPAFGSIPMTGVVPVAKSLDHLGPLTRCVSDARVMFEVMSGQTLSSANLNSIRFGLVREFFFEKGRAETAAQVEQVIQSLGRALGSCREVTPPTSITEMHRVHRLLMAYECAEVHCDLFASRRELYGPGIASLIEEGTKISVEDYQAAKNRTSEIQESWRETFNSFDVLAMPTTAGPAPASLATTGDPRWQSPWSLCGFPAITLPCGLSAEEMPVGLQLVSAENALLLAIAAECEERLAFQATPTFRTTSEMDSET